MVCELGLALACGIFVLWTPSLSVTQIPSEKASEPHQMILTKDGFLAIDLPKGWSQSEGPGLAFFLPEGVDASQSNVWIYINSAPVGPKEDDKDLNSYINSDIGGFKQRFKNGFVRKEEDLLLPAMKQRVSVYTFQSGEINNSFEQVIYIPDAGRALILDLSAKNSDAFKGSLSVFHEFAKSYRGGIQMGSPEK